MKIIGATSAALAVLALLIVGNVNGNGTTNSVVNNEWSAIRDGVLYVRPSQATETLGVAWQNAWQADANEESLFLQEGDGRLVDTLRIAADNVSGAHTWPLDKTRGQYRLEIPGYSFRGYRLTLSGATASVFEPTKVHFSAELPTGSVFYFRVPANGQAILNGKFHGDVNRLIATRRSDGHRIEIALLPKDYYYKFDSARLPIHASDEVWQLEFGGSGKAAFWLDGVPNVFALSADRLFVPSFPDGNVKLAVQTDRLLGNPPQLGLAMPYAYLPTSAQQPLRDLSMQTASFYTFGDVLAQRGGAFETALRASYVAQLGINHDITLLAGSGRKAVMSPDAKTLGAIDTWVAAMADIHAPGVHYLGVADEPNLNYPDYASFEQYFVAAARRVKENPRRQGAGVGIAAPVSSRFVNGPTREGGKDRKGLDWARRLLQDHGELVDAIAWHEWQVRDLMATRWYRSSIRQAADLVGVDAAGRPRKPLIISQTNISSGSAVSPYEQDSAFAALWWTSVVVNSSLDALLDQLDWFKAADEPTHPKGAFRVSADANKIERKPVADAMQFIGERWHGAVVPIDNSSFEVDAVALKSADGVNIIGVNKAPRTQVLLSEIDTPTAYTAPILTVLEFPAEHTVHRVECTASAGKPVAIPPSSIFSIRWKTHNATATQSAVACP